jgi:phosphoenolpyruvate carboxylase
MELLDIGIVACYLASIWPDIRCTEQGEKVSRYAKGSISYKILSQFLDGFISQEIKSESQMAREMNSI